uniref:Immunoglobulin C2-set-like ligand-binding domain-containing protein n=1 Tax=Nothoprocta perdicaria TaxID=30464 RepID=A0A8C6YML0_NOTPE
QVLHFKDASEILFLFLTVFSLDAEIFPSSPEILRGTTLKLLCVLGNHYVPQRNASHIIWKLNHELIAQENYNVVNETVSSPCVT